MSYTMPSHDSKVSICVSIESSHFTKNLTPLFEQFQQV
jgi:hypothetical protein